MKVIKNNPYRRAKRVGERNELRNPIKNTLTKQVYALLVDKDDSVVVEYKNASTLKSMTCQLRQLSIKLHDGARRFRLRDNQDGTFTVFRII